MVIKDQLATTDFKVNLAIPGHRDQTATRVQMVQEEHQGILALKDQTVIMG